MCHKNHPQTALVSLISLFQSRSHLTLCIYHVSIMFLPMCHTNLAQWCFVPLILLGAFTLWVCRFDIMFGKRATHCGVWCHSFLEGCLKTVTTTQVWRVDIVCDICETTGINFWPLLSLRSQVAFHSHAFLISLYQCRYRVRHLHRIRFYMVQFKVSQLSLTVASQPLPTRTPVTSGLRGDREADALGGGEL